MEPINSLKGLWDVVYLNGGEARVQLAKDYEEATEVVHDLIRRGVPIKDISIHLPTGGYSNKDLAGYQLQQLQVKVLVPGPILVNLAIEVQRLIENYIPALCEVRVSESTTYSGTKEELLATDTHSGERTMLRKDFKQECIKVALSEVECEEAISLLHGALHHVDSIALKPMLEVIYKAYSLDDKERV